MMSEKRFIYGIVRGSRQAQILDCHTCKSATIDVYDDDFKYFVDKLNEQQATIKHLEEYCGDLEADVKRLMKENELLKKIKEVGE